MIYLFLSILCSTLILLIFRSFTKFNIHTYSAIVFNYLIAGLLGFILNSKELQLNQFIQSAWLPNALMLGAVFIVMFNIMAITTQKLGASVGSIANKMALIIPVVYAIIYYNDKINLLKISGIVLAVAGIVLTTLKPKTFERNYHKSDLLYPLLLLIGSGFIDTYLNYAEQRLLNNSFELQLFSSATFSTAFIIGAVIMLLNKKSRVVNYKTIVAGTLLGIVNFGSIYFLLEAFGKSELQSSVVFPFNNVGVVILTVGFSSLIFKERFNWMNKLGIALSIAAVILIALGR